MEIEQLRKELNHLLNNVIEHSQDFSNKRQIPSLEISVVLAKINKMQENLAVLRHLLQERENNQKTENKTKQEIASEITTEQLPKTEQIFEKENLIVEPNNEDASISDKMQQSSITKLVDAFNLNDRYLFANELMRDR